MPKTFAKVRKQIAKKRNGAINALHQGSRDSRRLHKAQIRDERLEKIAGSRKKQNQPLIDRAAFFQSTVKENEGRPLSEDAIRSKISEFVHQHDEEFEAIKSARRAGRPASAREDLLRMKVESLEREHQNGFLIPDLSSEENAGKLDRWEGSWSYLSTMSWVRIPLDGEVRKSSFPPKGDS